MSKPVFPQALATSFAHRLAHSQNGLFANLSTSRTSKRQATAKVNYAEDYNDDFDFDDGTPSGSGAGNLGTGDDFQILEGGHGTPAFDQNDASNYLSNNADPDANGYVQDDAQTQAEKQKAEVSEDPNAAYDIYRNLILNSNSHSVINLSNFQGNKEAPKSLPPLNFTPQQVLTNARNPQEPFTNIPIKLKINANGAAINDTFLWNLAETLVTPELYASMLAQDLDLNKATETIIITSIKEQIQQYKDLLSNPNNAIVDQFLANQREFHVVLDIATNIGEDFYTDKIEWDLLDTTTTPEIFARTVVEDVGLKPEFETAIACAVYDEIFKFKRELLENPQQLSQNIDSLPFFNLVNKDDLELARWQGIRFDPRKYGEEFSPSVEKLSEWEIEKRETEKERNLRRRKRETMRVAGGLVR